MLLRRSPLQNTLARTTCLVLLLAFASCKALGEALTQFAAALEELQNTEDPSSPETPENREQDIASSWERSREALSIQVSNGLFELGSDLLYSEAKEGFSAYRDAVPHSGAFRPHEARFLYRGQPGPTGGIGYNILVDYLADVLPPIAPRAEVIEKVRPLAVEYHVELHRSVERQTPSGQARRDELRRCILLGERAYGNGVSGYGELLGVAESINGVLSNLDIVDAALRGGHYSSEGDHDGGKYEFYTLYRQLHPFSYPPARDELPGPNGENAYMVTLGESLWWHFNNEGLDYKLTNALVKYPDNPPSRERLQNLRDRLASIHTSAIQLASKWLEASQMIDASVRTLHETNTQGDFYAGDLRSALLSIEDARDVFRNL